MSAALHGTALWAARRILAAGWSEAAAADLATPRMRTGPDRVYATLSRYAPSRWVAEQWAEAAAQRAGPVAGCRASAAVVEVASPRWSLRSADGGEVIATARTVTWRRVVAIGRRRRCAPDCVGCAIGCPPLCPPRWRWRWLT
jgi:hypothetical protein